MELRTLRYFVTIAQEQNITKAAQKLNMSQPPLSSQMQKLEDELGCKLFIRGKRRLQLTEEGVLLLRRAQQLLELEDKTKSELQHRQGLSGTLYFGMVEGRAPTLMAQWISKFRKSYPHVCYSLLNGSTDDLMKQLDRGLIDLALLAAPYNTEHLQGLTVWAEAWVAIIPIEHPIAQIEGDTVELAQLAGQPLIVPNRVSRVQSIVRWFGEIGEEPNILCHTSHYVDALALTMSGVGISIFPQTLPYPCTQVVAKTITHPKKWVEYVLVWKKAASLSQLSQHFINEVERWREKQPPIRPNLLLL